MSPAEIRSLRALLARATPGPWAHQHYGPSDECVRDADGTPVAWCKANQPVPSADAALIAAAVNALPALLDEIEVLQGIPRSAGQALTTPGSPGKPGAELEALDRTTIQEELIDYLHHEVSRLHSAKAMWIERDGLNATALRLAVQIVEECVFAPLTKIEGVVEDGLFVLAVDDSDAPRGEGTGASGWRRIGRYDSAQRRALWVRVTVARTDNVIDNADVRRIELCAGREGDDAYVRIEPGAPGWSDLIDVVLRSIDAACPYDVQVVEEAIHAPR